MKINCQDVLNFAFYSGWRRGEITGLTWREIDNGGQRDPIGSRSFKNQDRRTAADVAAIERGLKTTASRHDDSIG
jgi:integrase